LKQAQTFEARLVHDADKIDLYLQALIYEQQSGNLRLAEFWHKPADFHFTQAQAVYEALKRRRPTP
jgi:5'-deoxynucleotidase YfbR-like HD superfamily hydrolase